MYLKVKELVVVQGICRYRVGFARTGSIHTAQIGSGAQRIILVQSCLKSRATRVHAKKAQMHSCTLVTAQPWKAAAGDPALAATSAAEDGHGRSICPR